MVSSQLVAGKGSRPVEDADVVLGGRPVGARQLGYKDDPKWTLPWPKLDWVVVSRLVCLFKDIGWEVSWQLKCKVK